ncbi:MAG: sigma-70 family RNA polymerase sigma factor [Clostridia bacterium]|nr:sigma-70 family RNA polymerase sigma factor [Clostridia bacterium]
MTGFGSKNMNRREEALESLESAEDAETLVLTKESRAAVERALKAVHPVYRYTLILKYLDGYKVKEIARILGRTPKAVDGILQKAKLMFRKEFEREPEGTGR